MAIGAVAIGAMAIGVVLIGAVLIGAVEIVAVAIGAVAVCRPVWLPAAVPPVFSEYYEIKKKWFQS